MVKVGKKKRPKKQSDFIQTLSFFVVTITSIGGLILYLWVYSEIDQAMTENEYQRSTLLEIKNTLKELENDIAQLNRVDRITSVAKKELGMVFAKPESISVYVDHALTEGLFD